MLSSSLTSKRLEFEDASEAASFYFEKGWTDGLPVVPPTADSVARFLEYAGRSPSEILGTEPVKGRVITAEKVAINAVMAGCLPEYFPVVAAAVEAISEPQFNLHAVSVSTMGATVLTVVNGPIVREIGLNSGVGVFSSGHRANATIGRAIRLVITNVTGAAPGQLDKATLGHPGRYTWCMAEAEEVSPWAPLHVERGINIEKSAVTVFPGLSPIQGSGGEGDPETIVASVARAMFTAGAGQDEIVVVLTPELIGHIRTAGWSKRRVQELLFEAAQRKTQEGTTRVANSPESITVLVAGGAAGGFYAVIPLWGAGSNSQSVTREVQV